MKRFVLMLTAVLVIAATVLGVSVCAFADSAGDEFMIVRESELKVAITKNKIPSESFSDQSGDKENPNARLTKSPVGITDQQMFRVTRTTAKDTEADNQSRRMATVYSDRRSATNAEAYMYYMEFPDELEDPVVEFSWNLYDGDSTVQQNGHIYSGIAYYLAEDSKSWVPATIEGRFFELPTAFKGYILFKPSECKDIGTSFNKEWQLETTHVYVHGLRNETVLLSRPFMVEKIGNMSFAAHIGDGSSVLSDLFSGEELAAEDAVYELKVGDTIYSLPVSTADMGASAPDLSYLPTRVDVEWNAFDNAVSYSVKLFMVKSTTVGKSYVYEKEVATDKTSARFEALTENARYYVVVYALDANGKEIAVSDSLDIYALRGINFDKADEPEGLDISVIIIIAVAALVIIAVVVVIVVLVSKKKKQ